MAGSVPPQRNRTSRSKKSYSESTSIQNVRLARGLRPENKGFVGKTACSPSRVLYAEAAMDLKEKAVTSGNLPFRSAMRVQFLNLLEQSEDHNDRAV